MKKKLTFLLTTLVLALALCMGAAAAQELQVGGLAQGQTGYLAGYNDDGRMVGVRVLTADGDVAASIPNAAGYKLFRLDERHAPQGEALAFSQSDGTVRKIDGQVCVCYGDPEGLAVRAPVTEKVTGKVSLFFVNGDLLINGARYSSTTLTVEGCDFWDGSAFIGSTSLLSATCDFYLDPDGDICWIEQLTEGNHQLCLPCSAVLQENGLQALVQTSASSSDVLNVTRLDGKPIGDGAGCISSADALAQLKADCEKTFYTFGRWIGGGYHLVRTGKGSPVDTGYAQNENYVIPEGSPIQADADFTFGTIGCLADENTRFWVAVGPQGEKTYQFYRGFQELPNGQARGCALAESNGVAYLVYLDMPYFAVEPPEGCIFITNKGWQPDPELYRDDVYQVNIVDANGAQATLRIPESVKQEISLDSMTLDALPHNTYAGKFCRIAVMDQNDMAWGLEPVETHEVQALDNGAIVTAAGSWRYDNATQFVYVDLGWEDNMDDPSNQIGVCEPAKDLWVLWDSGSLEPTDFRPAEIGEGQIYSSVRAAVIPSADDETLAQYVYVIRECN